ncbi:MAG TPA: hypothetical protein VL948_03605 [Verrucomicrobiae bacterium]|jgi:hypothetical protein|nr:hypothetical protein [Verrucomicrobiae bacterium]
MKRRAVLVGLIALVVQGCEYLEPKKFGLTTAERKQVYLELFREYQRHGIPGPGPWDTDRTPMKDKKLEAMFWAGVKADRTRAEVAVSQRTGLNLVEVGEIYREGQDKAWRGVPR